jgi:hypothetical protein
MPILEAAAKPLNRAYSAHLILANQHLALVRPRDWLPEMWLTKQVIQPDLRFRQGHQEF